jgi:putative transposase
MSRLAIVDHYTRECLEIEANGFLELKDVVLALTYLALEHPLPRYIKADNGNEFISKIG